MDNAAETWIDIKSNVADKVPSLTIIETFNCYSEYYGVGQYTV
jgi:hypothetical protein